ncbi:MAG: MOSC domain-containing protein [Elusimicrobia bacterium]|nr:MOSC domain-containing protein [Elusimicrobiota bacterium]
MDPHALIKSVLASPKDAGTLKLIVLRLADKRRLMPPRAVISAAGGVEGDRWSLKPGPDPSMQVSLINARFIEAAAGGPDRAGLSGDNLAVDLDISEGNLPAGTRLRVGAAVLEITGHPHKGCGLFERRYGKPARDLVDSAEGRALRLRGVYARVVTGGEVRLGDPVGKDRPL